MALPRRLSRLLPAAASLAAAAIWLVLATRGPTLTYHFAPVIAAVVWPWLSTPRTDPPSWPPVVGGTATALLATALLASTDSLRGPTLWGSDGALGESIAAALIGGAIGWLITVRREAVPAPV